MALTLIYGNSGSGKSEYLYRKIDLLAHENPRQRFFVVVPEQFTMQTQKEFVSRAKNHVIMNIDVVSFERLAFRIFDETGWKASVLEDTGKSLILRKIAEENQGQLTVLRTNLRRMGYIEHVKSVISELMQYEISPDDLEELLDGMAETGSLYYKLSDILVIYREFVRYMEGDFITAEQLLDVLADQAGQSQLLENAVFAFDGFTGFTPVQMKCMHALMQKAADIFLTVTFDPRENIEEKNRIENLFYMSRRMAQNMMHAAMEERIEIASPVIIERGEKSRFSGNPMLDYLEQNLFRSGGFPEYSGACSEAIGITSCLNAREELDYAVSQIASMMRNGDYHYSDFAIVSAAASDYEKYAAHIFRKYHVPYFADMKRDILFHPLTECIRSVLEIQTSDYSQNSVFRFLKCGLCRMPAEDVDLLENYAIARGIHGYRKWSKPFRIPMRNTKYRMEHGDEQQQKEAAEEMNRLNELRQQVNGWLDPLHDIFLQNDHDVRRISTGLVQLLEDLQAQKQLQERSDQLQEQGEEADALVYRQIFRTVMDLFDKMVSLLGDDQMDAEEYAQILDAGFAEARVGIIPPGSDCVILGDIERTRLDHIRVLFFLGVNDGIVPLNADNGGILSQYDRDRLRRMHLELAPSAREQVFLQKFYLYWNLTKPSQGLYLTYARTNSDGNTIRPSYLIQTMLQMFPQLKVQEEDEEKVSLPVTPEAGVESYLKGLSLAREGTWLPEFGAMHRWYQKNPDFSDRIMALFNAGFHAQRPERLMPSHAQSLYGTSLSDSVSRLEQYSQCAFAHFLKYGLHLREREEYTFAAVDMGTLFHEILERFSRKVDEQSGWYEITGEECDRLLEESIFETELGQKDSILYESARNEYVLTMVRRIVRSSVHAFIRQIRAGSFQPAEYEKAFWLRRNMTPDKDLPADAGILLNGKIDRMDLCRDTDSNLIRVIDYKSGNRDFSLQDFYYGLQMQLVVYMEAAMETMSREEKPAVPGGIFYYHIDDPMIEGSNLTDQNVRDRIQEHFRLKGLVSSDPDIYQKMDQTITDKSRIIPLKLKKDGSIDPRNSHTASRRQFSDLMEFSDQKIEKITKDILKGNIDISPFELEDRQGCTYCPYHSVCGFDQKIPGFSFRRLKKLSEAELWEEIHKEANGEDER